MNARRRGFTLIEMIVALAIVSLMSVAMLQAWRFSQRALTQTTRVDAAVHEVAATQRLLRRIVEHAYPFETGATVAPGAPRGLMGQSRGFTVTAPAPGLTGGVGMYRYDVALTDGGDLEVSWELDRNGAPDTESRGAARRETLLGGVESMSVEYLELVERGNGEIESFWHETWVDKPALPALVRIRLKFSDGDRHTWPELVVAPRISTDANCVFDVVSQMCRMAS